jgi:hypothetical protein
VANNLFTSFVRRITKYFTSASTDWYRPRAAAPGTNHIDDPSEFTPETIYRGEEIFDFTRGKLYTQDGAEIVEPNTMDGVVQGMVLKPSVTPNFISVESGAVRVNGKTYWREQVPANSGDVQIDYNSDQTLARIDIIYAEGNYPSPAPSSLVGTSSTEFEASVNVITGSLGPVSRAITFFGSVGTASGSGTIRFSSGPDSVKGLTAGDEIVGPSLPRPTYIDQVDENGYYVVTDYVYTGNLTNGEFLIPYKSGVLHGFTGSISAGSNQITNVYPISGDLQTNQSLIVSPSLPANTRVTSVDTVANTITLNNASQVNYSGVFQVGDVADELQYPLSTEGWPNLGTGQVMLGLVVVPPNFIEGGTVKARPISLPKPWQSAATIPSNPQDFASYLRSINTYYTGDSAYISDQIIIDRLFHAPYQVVSSHYSTSIDSSLDQGYVAKIGGAGAIEGLPGPGGAQGPAGSLTGIGNSGFTGAILYWDPATSPKERWGTGSNVIYYSNSEQMTATVGGLAAGTTFNGVSLKDLLDDLLYPYQSPAFTSFTFTPTSYENGQTAGNSSFAWAVSNFSNVNTGIDFILSSSFGTTANYGATATKTSTSTSLIAGTGLTVSSSSTTNTASITLYGKNSQGATFSSSRTLSWYHRGYFGRSFQTSIGDSGATGFGSLAAGQGGTFLAADPNRTYTFNAPSPFTSGQQSYIYFVFPTSWGSPQIYDSTTNYNITETFNYAGQTGTFGIRNSFGQTATYNYWRSQYGLNGAITLYIQ